MQAIILAAAAALAVAVLVGILIGFGLTEQSMRRSWDDVAQQRRLLNERERAIESMLAEHHRWQTEERLGHPVS